MQCRCLCVDYYALFVIVVFGTLTLLLLTPSHYGFALEIMLEAKGYGPKFGEARIIRSDEFSIATPLIQMAVNNRFQRYHHLPPFHHDLRTVLPVPLLDWAILLKPSFWLFFIHPSYGFAFFHQFHACILVVGFYYLLVAFGVARLAAVMMGFLIFFSGYIQAWWMNLGLPLAYLPWLALALLTPWSRLVRAIAFSYIFAVMVFSTQVYPPVWVGALFFVLIIALAYDPRNLNFRLIAFLAAGSAIVVGLLRIYLDDCLEQMKLAPTFTNRRYPGGTLALHVWLSMFYPSLQHERFVAITNYNICEGSTVGSLLPLLFLCFLNPASLRSCWSQPDPTTTAARRFLIGMFVVFCIYSLWQLLPCPWWLGSPLLLHTCLNNRVNCFPGLALLLGTAVAMATFGVRLTFLRSVLFSILLVGVVYLSKVQLYQREFFANRSDLYCLVPLICLSAVFFTPFRRSIQHASVVVLTSVALIANIMAWGSFNPLQSAKPIFSRPESATVQQLRALAKSNPEGICLTTRQVFRFILAGYDIPSAQTVFLVPPTPRELAVLRRYIPSSKAEDHVLHTYFSTFPTSHALGVPEQFRDTVYYNTHGIVLEIPLKWFLPSSSFSVSTEPAPTAPTKGTAELRVVPTQDEFLISGYLHSSAFHSRTLVLHARHGNLGEVTFYPTEWPSLMGMLGPEYGLSGFVIRARRPGRPYQSEDTAGLILAIDDPVTGSSVIPVSVK